MVFPPAANFLLPVRPLAILFRAKLRASWQQPPFAPQLPSAAWQQDWVVDCRPVGNGIAALKYLAPSIFRVALSNNRILHADDQQVTFRYTHRASGEQRTSTLPIAAFWDRFVAHILPKGFVKVRYYGFFRPAMRMGVRAIRAHIQLLRGMALLAPPLNSAPMLERGWSQTCPVCGTPMHATPLMAAIARAPPHDVQHLPWA